METVGHFNGVEDLQNTSRMIFPTSTLQSSNYIENGRETATPDRAGAQRLTEPIRGAIPVFRSLVLNSPFPLHPLKLTAMIIIDLHSS